MKKMKIIIDYNKTAEFYELRYKNIQIKKYIYALSKLPNLNKTNICLDLGCGTGLLYKQFKKIKFQIKCIGIDISSNMIKQALKKNLGYVIVGDAEFLPFRNEVFDYIFSFTLLQNVERKTEVAREAGRVVKEGNYLVFTTLAKNIKLKELKDIFEKVNLKILRLEKIKDSEDFICILKK